jgi:hypothetical protein
LKACISAVSRGLLAAASLLALAPQAGAQFTARTAPEPQVRQLRILPDTPSPGSTTLQAISINGGMTRGIDNGTTITWTPMATSLPTTRLYSAYFTSDSTFYVMTDGFGVRKTTDGGTTFTAYNGTAPNALGCLVTRQMQRVGSDVYVSAGCRSDSGLWKSSNDGASWVRLGTATIPADSVVNSFVATASGMVILATTTHGLFRSTNGGTNWAAANAGLAATAGMTTPNAFAIQCAATCDTLLANVHGAGVYKSLDAGQTWTSSSSGLPPNAPMASGMARDPANVGTFFVSVDGFGVYRSEDDGASWTPWGNTSSDPTVRYTRQVARDPSVPGKYYATKFDGVARTLDGGATWYASPLGRGTYNAIAHDAAHPGVAYGANATLLKIPDINAPVPVPLNNGIKGLMTDGAVYQSPWDPNVLYATTTNYGVYRSIDGGASWVAKNSGLARTLGQAPRIAFSGIFRDDVYLASSGDAGIGYYLSLSRGDSWTAHNGNFTQTLPNGPARKVNAVLADSARSISQFIATDAGLYRSVTGGGTWDLVYSATDGWGTPLPVSAVTEGAAEHEIFIGNDHTSPSGFVYPSSGVFRSVDDGITWTRVLAGRVQALRSTTGGVLFAGLVVEGSSPVILRSVNSGASWQSVSTGMTGKDVRALAISTDKGALLSASLEDGFYTFNGIQTLQFSAASYDVAESVGNATVTVTRTGGTAGAASVYYDTLEGGTATPGMDYFGATGTLSFAAGEASKTFTLPILEDEDMEPTETILLRLRFPANATGTAMFGAVTTATVKILANDSGSLVKFSASSATVTEGSTLVLTVMRTGNAAGEASVNWQIGGGTGVEGEDYPSISAGIVHWAAGDSASKTIELAIPDDLSSEPTRTWNIALFNPVGVELGAPDVVAVTLLDNDPGIAFANSNYNTTEGVGSVTLQVVRTGNTTGAASVKWTTANGQAIAGQDFGARGSAAQRSGTLSWAARDASTKTISIPILQDILSEGGETFTVALSAPTGGILGPMSTTTVYIGDDDIPAESLISFVPPKVLAFENAGNAVLTLRREAIGSGFTAAATVSYMTAPGTALASSDFTTRSGTVTWAAADSADKTITIPIVNNAVAEPHESFKVTLAGTVAGVSIGTPEATVTIIDDDEAFPKFGAVPDGWTVPVAATKGWHASNDAGAYEGVFTLKSDAIEDGETSQIEVTRTFAAGNITFRVKVSSEASFDKLRFFVDGAEKSAWSGTANTAWQLFSVPVTAGSHTLRWSYEKDGSASVGSDAAWIDAVVMP